MSAYSSKSVFSAVLCPPVRSRESRSNLQVVIQSDSHKEMNEYMEKYKSIHKFSFSGPRVLEREH